MKKQMITVKIVVDYNKNDLKDKQIQAVVKGNWAIHETQRDKPLEGKRPTYSLTYIPIGVCCVTKATKKKLVEFLPLVLEKEKELKDINCRQFYNFVCDHFESYEIF